MHEVVIRIPVAASAEDVWALRSDVEFDRFVAKEEGHRYRLQFNMLGEEECQRQVKKIFEYNPIPTFLRAYVFAEEVGFMATVNWHRTRYDKGFGARLSTIIPVFTDQTRIDTVEWLEPAAEGRCYWCSNTKVEVRIALIGAAIEAAITKGIRESFAKLPLLIEAYMRRSDRQVEVQGAHELSAEVPTAEGARTVSPSGTPASIIDLGYDLPSSELWVEGLPDSLQSESGAAFDKLPLYSDQSDANSHEQSCFDDGSHVANGKEEVCTMCWDASPDVIPAGLG